MYFPCPLERNGTLSCRVCSLDEHCHVHGVTAMAPTWGHKLLILYLLLFYNIIENYLILLNITTLIKDNLIKFEIPSFEQGIYLVNFVLDV